MRVCIEKRSGERDEEESDQRITNNKSLWLQTNGLKDSGVPRNISFLFLLYKNSVCSRILFDHQSRSFCGERPIKNLFIFGDTEGEQLPLSLVIFVVSNS